MTPTSLGPTTGRRAPQERARRWTASASASCPGRWAQSSTSESTRTPLPAGVREKREERTTTIPACWRSGEGETPHLQQLQEGWQTGFEPTTAGTTIRPPSGRASSESRMASGFSPASVCRRRTSICGDIWGLSGCTARNADFCLIGHTPGSKGRRRGSVQRQRAGRKSWNPDLQARHKRIPVALPAKMTLSRPRWGRARPSKRRRVGRLTPPWWIGSDMPAGMRMQEIATAGDYPAR